MTEAAPDEDPTGPQILTIESRQEPDRTVVIIAGELDAMTGPDLAAQLDELLDTATMTGIDLDLADLVFIDSSGIRALVTIQQRASEHGRQLRLLDVNDRVLRLLTATNLDKLFTIHP
jgi:anti-sigma B factor antagonist